MARQGMKMQWVFFYGFCSGGFYGFYNGVFFTDFAAGFFYGIYSGFYWLVVIYVNWGVSGG